MLTKRWCSLPHLATISKKYGKSHFPKNSRWPDPDDPWCHFATIACSNAEVKVLGRPRKKLGYVYLDLYRRPWGHTNRGRTISHKWTLHVNWWIYNKEKKLFMIVGKSRLVKQPCNQILGPAVGKGDLFTNPFFLGKRCWGALCLRESFVVETSLPKNVFIKFVCFCGIIICQARNGYGILQIAGVIEMHSIYVARSMYISEAKRQSQPNTAVLWGTSKLHSTHHRHPGNEDQLVGSSCTRVSWSCQIMSWPCLPLPGQPNVADASCGPIFSGKHWNFREE